jgi:glycoprotein-N-acetylgalactosamine 3-beta-galactosyltransferase
MHAFHRPRAPFRRPGSLPKLPLSLLLVIVLAAIISVVTLALRWPRLFPADQRAQHAGAGAFEAAPFEQSDPVAYKRTLCEKDMLKSREALQLLRLTPETISVRNRRQRLSPQRYPRVFCFVNTISVNKDRAQAVANTWGQRCDKLVFFSNETDTIYVGKDTAREQAFDVVFIDVIADHDHLWQKHKASLQYVYDNYRHDYDWFYKADDDAYVVVENLRDYLARPEIVMNYHRQPMQMGHRFNLTAQLVDYYVVDTELKSKWNQRFDRWVFNSGGPGYVMNRLYLDKIISILPDKSCLSDDMSEMLPDDASISYCMMWYGVFPWDTRDSMGRERWHADNPKGVYHTRYHEKDPEYWYNQYHRNIGGVRTGDECCAPDSIGFHYVKPQLMYHMERVLYFCRAGPEVVDMVKFNDKYGLAVSNDIMVFDPPKWEPIDDEL